MHIILLAYNVFLTITILFLCFIATYTDFRYGKVFNKHIIKFLIIGVSINSASFCFFIINKEIGVQIFSRYMINVIIGCAISYFMYHNKIWAAGDAKLYCTILFLIPYNLIIDNSLDIFPGFTLLAFIFSAGFIFLMIETCFLFIRDLNKAIKNKNNGIFKYPKIATVLEIIPIYFYSFFVSSIIMDVLSHFSAEFFINNQGFILLFNVLLISITLNIFKNRPFTYVIIFLVVIYVVVKIYITHMSNNPFYITFISVITLLSVIILRYLGSNYNYKEIPTTEVAKGMILSFDTIIQFKKSKVKGLPQFTTESTDSRITDGNIEPIMRWGKLNPGKDIIRIVRHMPFAPFISLGTVLFLLIRLYINFIK